MALNSTLSPSTDIIYNRYISLFPAAKVGQAGYKAATPGLSCVYKCVSPPLAASPNGGEEERPMPQDIPTRRGARALLAVSANAYYVNVGGRIMISFATAKNKCHLSNVARLLKSLMAYILIC